MADERAPLLSRTTGWADDDNADQICRASDSEHSRKSDDSSGDGSIDDSGTAAFNTRETFASATVDQVLKLRPPDKGEVYLKFFWKLLLLVAVFYGIPSMQFVFLVYFEYADTSFLPLVPANNGTNGTNGTSVPVYSTGPDPLYCYYNFKCAHSFIGLRAFNNVLSNVLYIVCGLSFNLFVLFRERGLERAGWRGPRAAAIVASEAVAHSLDPTNSLSLSNEAPPSEERYGLHSDCSLYYCLGWSLVLEGIFSALYHVCPSKLAFQFDMTFMILGGGFLFLTLYQKRQPTITSGPYRVYGYFGFALVAITLSLFNISAIVFWSVTAAVFVWISIFTSIHVYYNQKPVLSLNSCERVAIFAWHKCFSGWPRHVLRLAMIFVVNFVNCAIVTFAMVDGISDGMTQSFSQVILAIINIDAMIYLVYYVLMKYRHGERVGWITWTTALVMITSLVSAIYFYEIPVTNKLLSPAESAALNKPCVVLNYFDYHDVWHALSAVGVSSFFFLVYLLDSDTDRTPRGRIRVF